LAAVLVSKNFLTRIPVAVIDFGNETIQPSTVSRTEN
jgi:hypothetical protein